MACSSKAERLYQGLFEDHSLPQNGQRLPPSMSKLNPTRYPNGQFLEAENLKTEKTKRNLFEKSTPEAGKVRRRKLKSSSPLSGEFEECPDGELGDWPLTAHNRL